MTKTKSRIKHPLVMPLVMSDRSGVILVVKENGDVLLEGKKVGNSKRLAKMCLEVSNFTSWRT